MYAVRGEILFCEVDNIVTYLIVAYNYKNSVWAAHRLTHKKGFHATLTFVLEIRGVNVVAST